MTRVEIVIVGGGPAGLSAALVLGRCRRRVVVLDHRRYRNAAASHVRGFLTRDGCPPHELRAIARAEIGRYPSVTILEDAAIGARRSGAGFEVETRSHGVLASEALLLATGFVDTLPPVAGARELHGELVVPCPYCDAWEVCDAPLAAFTYGDDRGARVAMSLLQWSREVVLCSHEPITLGVRATRALAARNIRVEHRRVTRVHRDGTGLRVVLADGESFWRRRMFYHLGGRPASDLAERLGAVLDATSSPVADRHQATTVPGLYAAGDATRDVLQAMVAAGEGCAAGVSMNAYLTERALRAGP
jgi:thioredoxin reductase